MRYPLDDWRRAPRGYRFGEKTFYSDFHAGLDIVVPEGTPVLAPCDCSVVSASRGVQGGFTLRAEMACAPYGKLVLRCMHLKELPGKGRFREGDVIAKTGNTGSYSAAPHLHVDLSVGKLSLRGQGNFIDPEEFFNREAGRDAAPFSQDHMILCKKQGEDRIYALAGEVLIPLAVPLELFKAEFSGIPVEILDKKSFDRFRLSGKIKISPA